MRFKMPKIKVPKKIADNKASIKIIGGVVCILGGTVGACIATTKLPEKIEEASEKMDGVHELEANDYYENNKDKAKDILKIYAETAWDVTKLYGPWALSIVAGTMSIISGNCDWKKQVVGLGANLMATRKDFKDYRNRVIEDLGEDKDRQYRFGFEEVEVKETVEDPETGKKKTIKNKIKVANCSSIGANAVIFNKFHPEWRGDPYWDHLTIRSWLNELNNILEIEGHLYLNEALDYMNFKKTKAGQDVGWLYDEKNPIGDNEVSFGIDINHIEDYLVFVKYGELDEPVPSYIFDFNIDGPITKYLFNEQDEFPQIVGGV